MSTKKSVVAGMPNELYHSSPGISKSGLDLISKCPKLYYERYIKGDKIEPTPAMVIGSATHKAVLEPDRFSSEFVCAPDLNLRTKAGKAAMENFRNENRGKTVLSKKDYDNVMNISNAVKSHATAKEIFTEGEAELSAFHKDEDTEELVKVRPDWVVEDVIVDLKTTQDASQESFSRSCYNFNYHVQAAFYMDIFSKASGRKINNFIFVAVENKPPYPVAIYVADSDMIELGRETYRQSLKVYADCRKTGVWHGYGHDKITEIGLPVWAYR